MKDLNNKFLPELAKMEQTIQNYNTEIDKIKQIIREFDINLANKCNKQHMDIMNDKLDK